MVALFNLGGKPLLNTTVEVMCQTTGKTFRITSNKARKNVRCWLCNDEHGASESFEIHIGEGKGNVSVVYYGMDGSRRPLEKIVPDEQGGGKHGHMGLAGYEADRGRFILVSQEKV